MQVFGATDALIQVVFGDHPSGGPEAPVVPPEIPSAGAVDSVFGRTGVVEAEFGDYDEWFQPIDEDLTAIAGLITTGYGRGFLELDDPADAWAYLEAAPGNGSGSLEAGMSQLVSGQDYIDVVFDVPKSTLNWSPFCSVRNAGDPDPLNIWRGSSPIKHWLDSVTLNGAPDTDNYFLEWAINTRVGITTPPVTVIHRVTPSGDFRILPNSDRRITP